MKIKDLPIIDRPREHLIEYGAENLTNEDLLAILINKGTKNISSKDIAKKILQKVGNIDNLKEYDLNNLKEIKGIGNIKIIELKAIIELSKRIYLKQNNTKKIQYKDAKIIYEDNKYLFYSKKQELFYALYLDNKNKLIERKLLFIGTINRSAVHPREVFRYAYSLSASSIIIMHNHPSGDVSPSKEDYLFTQTIVEIGKIQGIYVIDHIIVSDTSYYSFFDNKDIN